MATPTPTPDTMVFQFLFESILQTIQSSAASTANTMAMVIGPGLSVLFGTYMLLWHFALAQGAIQSPLTDFYKRVVRGCLIIMFATTVGIYNSYIADFVWQVPGAIAQEIAQPGSTSISGTGSNEAMSRMLDKTLGQGLAAGQAAWQKMSIWNATGAVGYAILAFSIWIFVVLVCAYAAVLTLITAIGTAVMLGLGPLFISLAMFESTTAYFTAWVRQLTMFMIQFLIMTTVISLMFAFYQPFITSVAQMSAGEMIIAFVKVVAMSAVNLLVLHQCQSWAAGLAGGVSITAQGAVGRLVGGAVHGVAHRHYDPNKRNKDGTRGGHRYRGALPSTFNAGVYAAKRIKHAYQRRNSVSRD